jgi:hypothetical protein
LDFDMRIQRRSTSPLFTAVQLNRTGKIAVLNLVTEEPKDRKLAAIKAKMLSMYHAEGTLISQVESDSGMTEYKFAINPIKYKKCKPAPEGFILYDYPPVLDYVEWKTYFTYRSQCHEVCTCNKFDYMKYSTDSKDHTPECKAQEIITKGGFK